MAYVIERSLLRARSSAGLNNQDEFSSLIYLGEVVIKYTSLIMLAAAKAKNERKYKIILRDTLHRGNGVGTWITAKEQLVPVILRSNDQAFREYCKWFSQKNGPTAYFNTNEESVKQLTLATSNDVAEFGKSRIELEKFIVFLRNKNAHGAKSDDYYSNYNSIIRGIIEGYALDVNNMLDSSHVNFVRYVIRSGRLREMILKGMSNFETDSFANVEPGVYVSNESYGINYPVPPIYYWDDSRRMFYFPNSEIDRQGKIEVIDYASGDTRRIVVPVGEVANNPDSKSHTSGSHEMLVGSAAIHNLPNINTVYVDRSKLEEDLATVLLDSKRRLITLHGRGGAGKTTLALKVARRMVDGVIAQDRFETILWLSARNVDLLDEGAKEVVRDVSNFDSIVKYIEKYSYFDLSNCNDSMDKLKKILGEKSSKVLVILDNFETVENPKAMHDTLEDIIELPNKVLITSRVRQMERDFSITVTGMERAEAFELIDYEASARNVSGSVDERNKESIFVSSGGIPYLIKLMVYAFAGNTPRSFLSEKVLSDDQIREKLFRPSFESLSQTSKRVFLFITQFNFDLSIQTVSGFCQIYNPHTTVTSDDVYEVIQEISSYALCGVIDNGDLTFLSVPLDARRFGKSEIEDSLEKADILAVKTLITSHLNLLINARSVDDVRKRANSIYRSAADSKTLRILDQFLYGMSLLDPLFLLDILSGRISRQGIFNESDILEVVKKIADHSIENSEAKYIYGTYLWQIKDYKNAILNLIEASELSPENENYMVNAARYVNEFFRTGTVDSNMKVGLQEFVLSRMKNKMENGGFSKDEGYSQLYWIYLRSNEDEQAKRACMLGLEKFPESRILKELAARPLKG
ncbi:NB-ARC domain-containing protein [Deinococcus aestuarii]|uniref:NB-ARC domain-containing protein n=1 Tax=Deinococcus aestuarii TaxID=2774531 RepID=UPI001C0D411F|nr:NB-ARC domain-containing protein [Deinococcus aestuarii]